MGMELGFKDLSTTAKYVAVAVILIFLISLTSAETFTFDNVKSYDANKQEVTITNTFGLGEDIAKIKLDTPLNYYVPRGYQKVAELTINSNKEEYTNPLDKIEFYNYQEYKSKKDKSVLLSRQFDYKLLTYEEINVEDWKEDCKDNFKNGTLDCGWYVSGYHKEIKEKWVDFDYSKLKKGTYTIGIFTEVQKGDNIEWIPTFYGVKITEFASFSESTAVGLVSYWSMENPSNDLTDNKSKNNLTKVDTPLYSSTGRVGYGVGFDSNSDAFVKSSGVTGLNFSTTQDFAISIWINFSACANDRPIFYSNLNGVFPYYRINIDDTGCQLCFDIASAGGGERIVLSTGTASLNTFHHYVFMRNDSGTDIWAFKDGVYDATGEGLVRPANTSQLWLQDSRTDRYSSVIVDELGIWNRTLTMSEITELYNSGLGLTYPSNAITKPIINVNSPEDYFNTSVSTITFNVTALDYNIGGGIANVSFIFDTITETINTSGVNGTYIFTKIAGNGLHNWSVEVYNVNSSFNASSMRFINLTILSPNITLMFPYSYANYTNTNIHFNATITDNLLVQNVSFYVDEVLIETNTSGVNGTYEWDRILSEGTHNWSILAYDNDSNPSQSSTISFSIDLTNPTITIFYPQNLTYLNTTLVKVDNFTTNFTWVAFDTHLSTCIWYNGTANRTITCNANETIYLPYGSTRTFIAYANDTFGLGSSQRITASYDFYLYENEVNYTRYTTEANQERFNFTINKTSLFDISSVNLVYNGTAYPVTDYSSTSTYQKITKTLVLPSVNANANPTFYFSVRFSDGTIVNSTTNTQMVNNTLIANCTTYTNKIFNFTLLDEALQTSLPNGSIEATINLYSTNKTILVSSYSTYINNTDNLQICLSSNITNPNYLIDGVVKYNDLTHATEYYNFVNYSYTNATIGTTILLYDLLSTDSTEFQVIFRDENFVPLPDVLIYVNREYISENTFKTVELPKTDSQGQTIVHLVRNDINYNLYAVKNGVILATFNNLRAYCEDYTIGNCKLYLTASSLSPETYNISETLGITYTFEYYNATKLIVFTFISTDLTTSKDVNMVVWRNNFFGNTSFCNSTVSSIADTLTCNISSIKETDVRVRVEVTVEDELIIDEYVDVEEKGLDKDYYFLFLIFLLAFVFMFIESKTTVIIGVVLGFGTAFALGLVKGKMFGYGSAGIFLIIMSIIMIWKLNKEKQQ